MDVLTTAIIWLKCDLDKESHVLRMKNQDHDRNLSSDSRVANKNIRHPSLICISDKQQQKNYCKKITVPNIAWNECILKNKNLPEIQISLNILIFCLFKMMSNYLVKLIK